MARTRLGRHSVQGFSLMEIMIALLLLALVIAISVEVGGGDLAAFNRMKDATLARWVASNRIAEVMTETTFPSLGKQQGDTSMGGVAWHWEQEISATQEADLRKIKVSVFRDRKSRYAAGVEVGYIAKKASTAPQQQAVPPP